MFKYTKSNRGFTLIELLVVIAIIGILSGIVLTSLNSARVKAKEARIMAAMSQIRVLAETSYNGSIYNVAASNGYANLISDISAQGGTGYAIYGDGTSAYAAQVRQPSTGGGSGLYICVDSLGTSTSTQSSTVSTSDFVCGS